MYAHVHHTVREKLPAIVKVESIWLNIHQEEGKFYIIG
jgi:hypothetical protein